MCQNAGNACDRAYQQSDDDTVYTSYAAYDAPVHDVLDSLTFGKAHRIAMFKYDDYRIGMSGREIKNA